MTNVIQVWTPRTRIQAHVRQSVDNPATYILTCMEALDGDDYDEAVTSEQTFRSHEGCLVEAIAWAGPHSAIVWDHVNGVTYDPNGGELGTH